MKKVFALFIEGKINNFGKRITEFNIIDGRNVFKNKELLKNFYKKEGWKFEGETAQKEDKSGILFAHIIYLKYMI
jgi:phosphotransacetylase